MTDARQILIDNLPAIDDVIAFVCRRNRLNPTDADEFAAIVKLRLVENDYAIIRAFKGDSSFVTFISIVIHRLLLDVRVHEWGRWRPSSEAARLGPVAIELERHIYRDGCTEAEAIAIVRNSHADVPAAELERLAAKIPHRRPRHREVPLDDVPAAEQIPHRGADGASFASDQEKLASRVSGIVREFTRELPPQHQVILQLRFECGMTIAEIARSLQVEQRSLYHQLDKWLRELRRRLTAAGIGAEDIHDLLDSHDADLDFAFVKNVARPSKHAESPRAAGQEEI